MKIIQLVPKNKNSEEHHDIGAEFSVLNSQRFISQHQKSYFNKSLLYPILLYILSIISITSWIISLKVFEFGHWIQFGLGALVLVVNFLIFKFSKI